MSEERNELLREEVSLVLDGSDAVCEGCGSDPREVDFDTVCFDWLITMEWENDDDGIAHVRCPKCRTFPYVRSDGKAVEISIPTNER